jgi:diketogulonate reductase-like aldo/keto reductase
VVRRAADFDGAAVLDGDEHRAGVGAVVRAGGADDGSGVLGGWRHGSRVRGRHAIIHASAADARGGRAPAAGTAGSGILAGIVTDDLARLPAVAFPDGGSVPAVGLGTWTMGEDRRKAAGETAALSLGLDLGMTLVDTAEMYGEGGAEEVVARAIAGRRDRVFVVSKVYPHNAGRKGAVTACERSLRRLGTDRLDLYLLHWRGRIPLGETVDAFERLRADGKILRWGVSNFDVADMRELFALPEGRNCATDQVLYHLAERGVEWELLPWLRERRIPLMAYSPLGQGSLLRKPRLTALSRRLGVAPAELALGWLLRAPDVIAIPESANPAHLRDNRGAASVRLDAVALAAIDASFPPPAGPTPLAVI